jgi:hypothetical protein
MENAKDGIRVNLPRRHYTPLHRDTPKDVMESLSPMGPFDHVGHPDAVMYLTATVTGHILYVDGGVMLVVQNSQRGIVPCSEPVTGASCLCAKHPCRRPGSNLIVGSPSAEANPSLGQ